MENKMATKPINMYIQENSLENCRDVCEAQIITEQWEVFCPNQSAPTYVEGCINCKHFIRLMYKKEDPYKVEIQGIRRIN
jgi:hypothetical protein